MIETKIIDGTPLPAGKFSEDMLVKKKKVKITKIEDINNIHPRSWIVETEDRSIAFCGFTEKKFIKELIKLLHGTGNDRDKDH